MAAGWRRWSEAPVELRDGLGGLALLVLAALPFVPGVELGELPTRHRPAVFVLVVVVQCLPLALRRRAPAVTLALASAGFAVSQLAAVRPTAAGLALFVALYSVGRWQEGGGRFGGRRRTAAAGVSAYAGLAVWLTALGSPSTVLDWVTFGLLLAAVWLVGTTVRGRTVAEHDLRERESATALADERTRIARELHDIVTHHVTAMVVQADAGAYVARDDRTTETFGMIAGAGRSALVELRHLLNALDPAAGEGAREPVAGSVATLVARVRAGGYPVELTEHGDPGRLSDGVALALVRIVQEATTNAMKHARSPGVHVDVTHGPEQVELWVRSAGGGENRRPGRGIEGMRQRAALVGGRLTAGPDGSDGFVVRATLPTRPEPGEGPA